MVIINSDLKTNDIPHNPLDYRVSINRTEIFTRFGSDSIQHLALNVEHSTIAVCTGIICFN